MVRYFVAYLYYVQREYYKAALMGEFVARRYPVLVDMSGEVVATPLAERLLRIDEDAYSDSLTYAGAAAEGQP